MNLFKNKKFLLLAGLSTGILILLVMWLRFNGAARLPEVISSTPLNTTQNVSLTSSLTVNFKDPVVLTDVKISSVPEFKWELAQPSGTTIVASHTLSFQPATTYYIDLSWKNQPLLTTEFTTIKSQEDPLLIQNMKDELARDYPLAQKLPYTTQQYRVVYSAPMELEITIKNPNLTSQEVIDEVKAWVTSQGGDMDAHKFTIATP